MFICLKLVVGSFICNCHGKDFLVKEILNLNGIIPVKIKVKFSKSSSPTYGEDEQTNKQNKKLLNLSSVPKSHT